MSDPRGNNPTPGRVWRIGTFIVLETLTLIAAGAAALLIDHQTGGLIFVFATVVNVVFYVVNRDVAKEFSREP